MRMINEICTFAPKSKIKAGEATKDGQYIFFTSSEEEIAKKLMEKMEAFIKDTPRIDDVSVIILKRV